VHQLIESIAQYRESLRNRQNEEPQVAVDPIGDQGHNANQGHNIVEDPIEEIQGEEAINNQEEPTEMDVHTQTVIYQLRYIVDSSMKL
jgi:hypothetical protein